MAEPFIGEIRSFGFNFPPKDWALCNGQLLPIAQNSALFSLLGTTYGGNGTSTFALPDLRGRVPVHVGAANPVPPALSVQLGQAGGSEAVALVTDQMPTHSHGTQASADLASAASPAGALMGAKGRGGVDVYADANHLTPLSPQAVAPAGGGQPHDNMQPSLVVNFCIALYGIYPSRS